MEGDGRGGGAEGALSGDDGRVCAGFSKEKKEANEMIKGVVAE